MPLPHLPPRETGHEHLDNARQTLTNIRDGLFETDDEKLDALRQAMKRLALARKELIDGNW